MVKPSPCSVSACAAPATIGVGDLVARAKQRAELVAAHPVGAAAARDRSSRGCAPSAASSASPAGWPKVSL